MVRRIPLSRGRGSFEGPFGSADFDRYSWLVLVGISVCGVCVCVRLSVRVCLSFGLMIEEALC